MAEKTLSSKIQLRNDTAANWSSTNPTLLKGEIGIEIDTRKFKIGDGTSTWSALSYANITDLSNYYTKTEIDTIVESLGTDISNVQSSLANKVDKVSGKGLSTNDYTTDEKSKLAGIQSGATKVEDSSTNGNIKINGTETNVYTLPSDVVQDDDYVHTDTNYTQAEKTKLSGIQEGATKVAKSSTNGNILVNGSETKVYTLPSDVVQDEDYVHTDNNYTATEKSKLSGIDSGAQVNKLEGVQVNGVDVVISNKKSNIVVPTKLSELTNDSGFILNTVSNLTNYYTKSQTYTKTEVNGLVNAISQFSAQIVTSLPTSNISSTTIYLVSKTDSESNDYYDEYLYINNAWEMIGNTKIDLSNYYTKSQTFSKTEVTQLVDGLGGQLETTNTQVQTNKTNIEALQEDTHTHSNKAILDQMTAAFTAELKAWYDDVGDNSHKHNNQTVLNKITQTYFDWWTAAYDAMHEHENLDVLEGITATLIANWNTAYSNSHTHSNKSVLDNTTASFTSALKTKLDGIATGANKTVVDTAMSETSTNPLQNKVITEVVNAIEEVVNNNAEDIVAINEDLKDKIDETDILILNCGNASGV